MYFVFSDKGAKLIDKFVTSVADGSLACLLEIRTVRLEATDTAFYYIEHVHAARHVPNTQCGQSVMCAC